MFSKLDKVWLGRLVLYAVSTEFSWKGRLTFYTIFDINIIKCYILFCFYHLEIEYS